jgi:hypothetical protein
MMIRFAGHAAVVLAGSERVELPEYQRDHGSLSRDGFAATHIGCIDGLCGRTLDDHLSRRSHNPIGNHGYSIYRSTMSWIQRGVPTLLRELLG